MEAGDVLAHELGGGPATVEVLVVGAVPDGGDVVEERVEPHVEHVAVVPRDLDSPVEAGTRDRQVTQTAFDERDDLVAHTLGLDEVGALVVQVEKTLLEVAHPEEVVGLFEDLDRTTVDLADEHPGIVTGLGLHQVVELLVFLAADAVVALVVARVDKPVVVELLEKDRDGLLVPFVGGADEVIVLDVDGLQQRKPRFVHQFVGPRLGCGVVGGRRAQDLLPVLVGTGQQPGIVATLAMPASENVSRNFGVRVPDVGNVVDIEDGRRNIEGITGGHWSILKVAVPLLGRITARVRCQGQCRVRCGMPRATFSARRVRPHTGRADSVRWPRRPPLRPL